MLIGFWLMLLESDQGWDMVAWAKWSEPERCLGRIAATAHLSTTVTSIG